MAPVSITYKFFSILTLPPFSNFLCRWVQEETGVSGRRTGTKLFHTSVIPPFFFIIFSDFIFIFPWEPGKGVIPEIPLGRTVIFFGIASFC